MPVTQTGDLSAFPIPEAESGQAMYRHRPRDSRGGTLNRLLEGTAYLFYRLESNFMRCLAIRGGACARAPGEHMPVCLPDAASRTAWAGRCSVTDNANPGGRASAWRDGLQGESGKPSPEGRAS